MYTNHCLMGYCNCHDCYIRMQFELAEVPRPFLQWPGNEAREMLVTRLWILVALHGLFAVGTLSLLFPVISTLCLTCQLSCFRTHLTSCEAHSVWYTYAVPCIALDAWPWVVACYTSDINFKPPFIVKRSFRSPFHHPSCMLLLSSLQNSCPTYLL